MLRNAKTQASVPLLVEIQMGAVFLESSLPLCVKSLQNVLTRDPVNRLSECVQEIRGHENSICGGILSSKMARRTEHEIERGGELMLVYRYLSSGIF